MYLTCAVIEHYPTDDGKGSASCEKTVASDDVLLMVWNTCYFSVMHTNRLYTAAGWRSAKFRGG